MNNVNSTIEFYVEERVYYFQNSKYSNVNYVLLNYSVDIYNIVVGKYIKHIII